MDTFAGVVLGIIVIIVGAIVIFSLYPILISIVLAAVFGLAGAMVGSIVSYFVAPGNQDVHTILSIGVGLVCIVIYYTNSGIPLIKRFYSI